MSLEAITNEIREKAGPQAGVNAVLKLNLGDVGVVRLDGTGPATVVDNADTDADCTIHISAENLQKLASGDLNPQMAFMMGKLRIEGDMSLALQLGSILG